MASPYLWLVEIVTRQFQEIQTHLKIPEVAVQLGKPQASKKHYLDCEIREPIKCTRIKKLKYFSTMNIKSFERSNKHTRSKNDKTPEMSTIARRLYKQKRNWISEEIVDIQQNGPNFTSRTLDSRKQINATVAWPRVLRKSRRHQGKWAKTTQKQQQQQAINNLRGNAVEWELMGTIVKNVLHFQGKFRQRVAVNGPRFTTL